MPLIIGTSQITVINIFKFLKQTESIVILLYGYGIMFRKKTF